MSESEDEHKGVDTTDHAADSDFDELDIPDTTEISKITDIPLILENNEKDPTDAVIPFSVVHKPPVKFKSLHRQIFIPGVDIKVQIIHNERSVTTHLLNPNLYTIELQHGEYTWTVKKRYKHLQHLHQQLRLFRASLNIPFPTKTHRERRESLRRPGRGALPRFPSKPEALVPYEQLATRKQQLELYLTNLLNIPLYRNHHETVRLLEVSHLSFVRELGSGREGLVRKRAGSTQPGQSGCDCLGWLRLGPVARAHYVCRELACARWRARWLFVRDSCLGLLNPQDGQLRHVVLLDQGFEVASAAYSARMRNAIVVHTLSRQLTIKCWTKRNTKEWLQYLKQLANNQGGDFTQSNRHGAYAPVRVASGASWFVDGASYMSAVADALQAATQEIYISDWWLSPEIYLKRRTLDCEHWRLDTLLARKASEGVKIFVLLYKEVELALGINSFYSKGRLGQLGARVLRHPDHARAGVFLWAHHEKLVVVDQTHAFLGGIDLCYGRWDDHRHRLTDLGSVSITNHAGTTKKKTSSTPGDSCFYAPQGIPVHPAPSEPEPRIVVSSSTPEPPAQTQPGPEPEPNLPVLQPGDSLLIVAPMSQHMKCNTPELERKSTFDRIKTKGKDLIQLIYNPNEPSTDTQHEEQQKLEAATQDANSIDQLDGSAKLWVGKDYTNFIVKDFANLESPYVDLVDRNSTPRMPWHDIGVYVHGPAARDVARHFIQRWNATKLEKARDNPAYPYLLPKTYNVEFPKLEPRFNLGGHKVSCQVLRSASSWSVGFLDPETVEQSIHEAYVDTIRRAKHYIYIENQFFVTLSACTNVVHNQIGDALFERITRAYREKSVFRVYVVMPLLPGFEGDIGGSTGTALLAVTHWNYASISRSQHGLLTRLAQYGIPDPAQYVNFYGLRTHSVLHREPVTELVYVHSKLLIADDNTVICGSANINDRSLLGKRDSELAVIIQDEEFVEGRMNGEAYKMGKYAGSLRTQLFKEHLGLLGDPVHQGHIDVADPVIETFYRDVWHRTATDNTSFYEKVFHCIPSDQVETFVELRKRQEERPLWHTEISRASVMLDSIVGQLVLLPLNFLCQETLTPAGGSVEGIMPTSLWT